MIVMIDKLIFLWLLSTSELMEFMEISVSQGASQGASQGRSFLARAFDLARPGVAPPLTPKSTADDIELDVAVRTCCVRPLRYDVNQLMTFSPRPYDVRNR